MLSNRLANRSLTVTVCKQAVSATPINLPVNLPVNLLVDLPVKAVIVCDNCSLKL